MIKWSGDRGDFTSEINSVFPVNPFACRIISLYNTYPPNLSFVDYWTIRTSSDRLTGAIARNGAGYILLLSRSCDMEEITSFLSVTGAKEILCDGRFTLDLPRYKEDFGRIMLRTEPYDNRSSETEVPPLREAYELIFSCAGEGFMPPPFEDYYLDLNHRLRHNAVTLLGVRSGDKLASVCMTVAESSDAAVLGAAACSPELRRRGFGSAVVREIVNTQISRGRTVFLHRAENKNIAFYDSLGFSEWGVWREYKQG